MEKIKIIALDMDGTTLRDDKNIAEETKASIQRAIDAGILIVPSSGRSLAWLPQQIMDFKPHYAITKNGAIIYNLDEQKEIYHEIIDNSLVIDFLKASKDLPAFTRIGYGDQRDAGYCSDMKTYIQKYPGRAENCLLVDDLAEYVEKKQPKIDKITMILFDDQATSQVMDLQKSFLGLNIMGSGGPYIEINSRMCSKGTALKVLATSLGMTKENVAAMGDSDNDIIMLAYAGHSFAMGNGTEFVRQIADEVTDDNMHNGVGKAIEKILAYNKNCDN